MPTVYLNRFDRGIVNDPRSQLEGAFKVVTNFDTLTSPRLLNPYRSTEDGDSGASTSQKQNFCIGYTGSVYRLFGLGRQVSLARAAIEYKGLDELDDNAWNTPANNESSSGSVEYNLFVFYKKTGMIYGASGTNMWKFDPSGGAWSDSYQTFSQAPTGQGLVHSKDDILYIPCGNLIATLNNTSFNGTALTLPSDLTITSISEYGNYLAIGCKPISNIGSSRVYLWDRDSSLTTISESIDWGAGNLQILEEIDGFLVGISLLGNTTTSLVPRIIFKYYTPQGAVKFNEITGVSSGNLTILNNKKQKFNSRIYFQASISINGSMREGLWSVGRSSPNEPLAVIHEQTPNNDTALSSGTSGLSGFFIVDDYIFQSYYTNSTYALSKTDDQANYTASGIVETTINPNMSEQDRPKKKQLISAGLLYESLPANGQAILKYKVDGGSYTTVLTETTDSEIVTERPDASGTSFTAGRDYEFRIESTGGAKITGLYYVYKVIPTLIQ